MLPRELFEELHAAVYAGPRLGGRSKHDRPPTNHAGTHTIRVADLGGRSEHTLHPRDYRVFAGVIDLDHWPAWGRLLFKALGGHAGDNRHWPEIDAWAEQIARALRAPE